MSSALARPNSASAAATLVRLLEARGIRVDGGSSTGAAPVGSAVLAKEIPSAQRHAVRPSLKAAFARLDPDNRSARDRLIATLHLRHGYTQAQIAAHLGLHYATVSRIINGQERSRNKT